MLWCSGNDIRHQTSENRPIYKFNVEFIAHFVFLTDISNHLMTINLNLQQKE